METVYRIIEILAVLAEGLIVLSVPAMMCEKKYGKGKNTLLIIVLTSVYTALICFVNNLQLFSVAGVIIAMLYSFAANLITSKGSGLLRVTALSITWFFLHAFDYVVTYGSIVALESLFGISGSAALIMGRGTVRAVFLVVSKSLQLLLFFLLRRPYSKIKLVSRNNHVSLLIICCCAYVMMNIITGLIFNGSLVDMQLACLLCVFFVVISVMTTVSAVSINSRYQTKKMETALMAKTNQLMQSNFEQLQQSQNTISRQVHDFKNHLRTINGMLNDTELVKKYVEDLLCESSEQTKYCKCGNNIIDSVINCKIAQAKQSGIELEYSVNLNSELNISSVDICAVLANQIDNALEACSKMSDKEHRFIKVEIKQREAFVFFKVANSCSRNPFNKERELVSTKDEKAEPHGFGIKNISRIAQQYSGTLMSDYKQGCFISIAMMCNSEKEKAV